MTVVAKKVEKTLTYKIIKQVADFKTAERETWIKDCKENEEFEVSRQWSEAETNANKTKGNYMITVNVLERVIEYITGMLTAKLPEYFLHSKNKKDNSSAKLGKKILSWVFEESRGLRRIRKFVHDGLAANIGHLFVYADDNGDIKFTNLDYNDIIIDPASKDFLFDDARAIFIQRRMSVSDAKLIYGISDLETGFPNDWNNVSGIGVGTSNAIPGDITNVYSNTNTVIHELFTADREYMTIYERYSKRKVKTESTGKIETRIVKEILLGYDHIVEEVLPANISNYPFVSFYYKDTKNPYKIGKIHLVKEIQRFVNKLHGLILKNTLTLGTPKVFVESQAVPNGNIEAFKRNIADPSGVVVINPGLDGRKPYEIVQGVPTPSAPMELYQNALMIMELNTAPKQMVGMGSSGENASASIFQKENLLDSFKTMAGVMEDALERLGSIIIQYVKAYTSEDKIVNIGEGAEVIEELELNKKNKLDASNPKSIEAYTQVMLQKGKSQLEIDNDIDKARSNEEYAAKMEEYITNSTSDLDLYVKVVPGSYASMFDSVRFQILTMLAQMGAVHPSVLIDYAPLDNREEIKKQSNTAEMAFKQLNEMQQQMEGIGKEIEKTKQENAKLKEQMVDVTNKSRMDYLYKDARVKESKAKTDLNFAIKQIKDKTNLQSKELIFNLKQILKDMEEQNVEIEDPQYEAMMNSMASIIDKNIGE